MNEYEIEDGLCAQCDAIINKDIIGGNEK